jgi:hypothetical protein
MIGIDSPIAQFQRVDRINLQFIHLYVVTVVTYIIYTYSCNFALHVTLSN